MKRLLIATLVVLASGMPVKVCAQQFGWSQYSVSYNYESFGGTYEKPGDMLAADIDIHWRSPVFGSLLVGYSWYDGYKHVTVDYGDRVQSDNVSDKKTQLMFAVGPGLDLLSNNIDRFYIALYGGYAIVKYEYDYYDGTERNTQKDDLDGVMCLGRIGYEHQFGRSTAVGVFVQGSYVGKEFNWGVGVRVGFRISDFNVKKPMRMR
jgi:hypothetical protein